MAEPATPTDPTTAPAGCRAPDCGAPTGDDAHLCILHTAQLRRALTDIPTLLDDLDIQITRQNRGRHDGTPGGGNTERPLPWNEHASACRHELATTVNAWALEVSRRGEDERDPLAPIPADDIPAVTAWLLRNINGLRRHPDAGAGYDELVDATTRAVRAVDLPPDRVFAGRCGTPVDPDHPDTAPTVRVVLGECVADVYGYPGATHARCTACGAIHDLRERRDWMLTVVADQWATSGLLAGLVGRLGVQVGSSTIRAWAAAGRLTIRGHQAGRPLYRVGDVVDLILTADTRTGRNPAGAA